MEGLVKALRKEARTENLRRNQNVELRSQVSLALSRISKEDRHALKTWYTMGCHAWTLERVARRIARRLSPSGWPKAMRSIDYGGK